MSVGNENIVALAPKITEALAEARAPGVTALLIVAMSAPAGWAQLPSPTPAPAPAPRACEDCDAADSLRAQAEERRAETRRRYDAAVERNTQLSLQLVWRLLAVTLVWSAVFGAAVWGDARRRRAQTVSP